MASLLGSDSAGPRRRLPMGHAVGQQTYIVVAYTVMAYLVMAYIVVAYIAMAYVVMAYIVVAYVVMAEETGRWPTFASVQAVVVCYGL